MQTLVDISNAVGIAIPNFIASVANKSNVSSFTISFNFGQGALYLILWLILVFVALGALLIGIAGLVARILIIYGLVLLAPIAFLAWVLPNTEGMFKKWWSNLTRVLMMFPIVTGMLSLAILFQGAVLNTAVSSGGVGGGVSATVTNITAALAPIIALILIPKTFKWGGDAFVAAAGYAVGKATAGKDWGKKSAVESSKSGRAGQALNKMAENPVLGRVPGIGGISQRQRYANIAKRQSAFDKKMGDGLDKVSDGNLKNLWGTQSYFDEATGQRKAKNTPYAKAVEREMNARRGKKQADYASAYRDGRYADAGRAANGLRELDAFMGVPPTTTEDRLNNMRQRIDQSTGSAPSREELHMAQGAELTDEGRVKYDASGNPTFKEPPAPKNKPRARDRARGAWNNRGQGGYIDPSAFVGGQAGSTGGATTPPPYTGTPPVQPTPGAQTPPPYTGTPPVQPSAQTPPPYTGPAAPWQPAPTARPTSGPVPAGSASGGDTTIINNITQNGSSDRGNNRTIISPATPGSPAAQVIPASVASDAGVQFRQLRERSGGGSDGLARLEQKINDLQGMMQREGRNSENVKKLMRDARLEAGNLPDHERGTANDVLSNVEQQSGLEDSSINLGDSPQ